MLIQMRAAIREADDQTRVGAALLRDLGYRLALIRLQLRRSHVLEYEPAPVKPARARLTQVVAKSAAEFRTGVKFLLLLDRQVVNLGPRRGQRRHHQRRTAQIELENRRRTSELAYSAALDQRFGLAQRLLAPDREPRYRSAAFGEQQIEQFVFVVGENSRIPRKCYLDEAPAEFLEDARVGPEFVKAG